MEFIKYFRQFFKYFKESKKAFIFYSCFSVIAAVLELAGVTLVYPFVLKILKNGIEERTTLIIGISIIAIFLLKNLFMIFYINLQARFTNSLETNIKQKVMRFLLNSRYEDTFKITIAEKNNLFNLIIPNVTNNFILRLLNINVNAFIFCLISALLAIKFPLATLITFVFAIVLVRFQNHVYKPLLSDYAKKASDASLAYHQSLNESVLNFKGIKISNGEEFFINKFNNSVVEYYKNCKKMSFLTQIPPYVTEPFAIIILFILLVIITVQNVANPEKLVASFALIASGIFRLVPTISRIQVNINGINSALPFVKEFVNFYQKYNVCESLNNNTQTNYTNINKFMEFKNVCFGYEKNTEVLHNLSFKINKGDFIGIMGASGVGKTTLVDLISGLFEPTSGQILIDGHSYDSKLNIGYIPQDYKIINGSIKDNITFGSNNVDEDKVIDSLKKAQLYEFIINNFKDGINASPFNDSIGFSQGQKQRLAIARALYTNPEILILDEATSALDIKTENEICNVLNNLKREKTIIAIAHRLSTIKSADKLLYLENGAIVDFAPYNELIIKNNSFKELINLANR